MRHGRGYYGSRRYDPPSSLQVCPHGAAATPHAAAQVEADCIKILADDRINRDERDAARAVIAAVRVGISPPRAAVDVLAGYVRRNQGQDRYGH